MVRRNGDERIRELEDPELCEEGTVQLHGGEGHLRVVVVGVEVGGDRRARHAGRHKKPLCLGDWVGVEVCAGVEGCGGVEVWRCGGVESTVVFMVPLFP